MQILELKKNKHEKYQLECWFMAWELIHRFYCSLLQLAETYGAQNWGNEAARIMAFDVLECFCDGLQDVVPCDRACYFCRGFTAGIEQWVNIDLLPSL